MSPLTVRRHEHIMKDVRIVLVRLDYPENLGAVCRAMRVTGFNRLILVSPGKLANPAHPQAKKMAVGALSILEDTVIVKTLDEAVKGCDLIAGTTARPKVKGILSPRNAAQTIHQTVLSEKNVALVFGGEGSGLTGKELDTCDLRIKIPMTGNQPSLNLAQAAMIILYELLVKVI